METFVPAEADATIDLSVVMQAGGFTGVTTCRGSGVTVRSVVLASRLVHAGIATSIASERVCIDPRTLLRLPIGLCLQILDCRFSLVRGQLLLEAFLGFIEAGVAVNFFGAAQQTES